MRIGELASRAGVNVQTIRYYERRNILTPSSIADSGYRHYREEDLKKLRFIKQTQELGFSLSQIEAFLRLRSESTSLCGAVSKQTAVHLADVRSKIRLLQQIEKALEELLSQCRKNPGPKGCPFLDTLNA